MTANEIVFQSARSLADSLTRRDISAREVMQAHLDQIATVNPKVNAIVSALPAEQALALADVADKQGPDPFRPLHGLPIAFKDLEDAVGFPTTSGSPIYRDFRPTQDSVIVERLRNAGVIPIGKTNVPEFGLGSHTYNPVFGPTRNPWNIDRTAGGSSGGAAVAIATGMLPLADGSDMGGSLRNPGNFNSVVGFRPSPGLVPKCPSSAPWLPLSVKGPIARSVADVAFFLSAMAGFDGRDQLSYEADPRAFANNLGIETKGLRVAWATDLGGLPVEPAVRSVVDSARPAFDALGCTIDDISPDFTDADAIFKDLRAFSLTGMAPVLREYRELLKPEAIWNIEQGLALTAENVANAMAKQAELFTRINTFMQTYDAFVCVVNQVSPFPVDSAWPAEIDGVKMETYVDWMKSAYYVTVSRLPAISVPAGFTPDGLPVGIQIVGRYRGDLNLLKLAHAVEQSLNLPKTRPPVLHG